MTDANNHVRRFVYDTLGNLKEEYDAFDKKTTRAYDTLFRLTGLTDPLNRNVAFTYNNLDHRERRERARHRDRGQVRELR